MKKYSINVCDLDRSVKGKRILITGAGGSIGSELTRMAAKGKPECLILLSHSEHTLFTIGQEIRTKYPDVECIPALGDVRSRGRMGDVFQEYRPDLVFHTAAIKHVPIAENHICEAVLTNITGTRNVVRAARYCGAGQVVFVSTDKAVNPSSVMGATKRAAELFCADWGDTIIKIVRFGNVIGSSGSVIPIFQKCIDEDRPLQVTHREVDRYFMEIPEAVALILQAVNIHQGDNLFVLDMGNPVNIYDLAQDMIDASDKDLPIEITGLRPGEKIHEELFYPGEGAMRSRWDGILQGTPTKPSDPLFSNRLDVLEKRALAGRTLETHSLLKQLVPEYE